MEYSFDSVEVNEIEGEGTALVWSGVKRAAVLFLAEIKSGAGLLI